MSSGERKRSWWAWGYQDTEPTQADKEALRAATSAVLGTDLPMRANPDLSAIELRSPRITPPNGLAAMCSTDPEDRAGHTYGKSFRDIIRCIYHDLANPPDAVAYPESEADVVAILDWCNDANIAAIPYGGGSSVVGGVETDPAGDYDGVVSIDLGRLDQVLEVDPVSRAAGIQAGAYGPALEAQLKPHGYTLRHFPQSFEFSTLGGWLATRSGGHYASVYTHIDDLCESMRVVTPAGTSQSFRLPGSGAGPSHDRLFLGSEGSLGIITEAWMRIQDRPVFKASAGCHFDDMAAGAEAIRAITQSGLFPTNCRILDEGEAAAAAGVTDGTALLVLGFESADHPLGPWMDRAVELVKDHGGDVRGLIVSGPGDDAAEAAGKEGAVGAWRNAFIQAPYSRNSLASMSVISETFETSCTWDRFPEFHADVMSTMQGVLNDVCGSGTITCRFTHVYPDGPAPYFTLLGPGRPGSELEMWDEIKAAASDLLIEHGSTITHHHAVGRDHDPWYKKQISGPFHAALSGAKSALDPNNIMNPGVIV